MPTEQEELILRVRLDDQASAQLSALRGQLRELGELRVQGMSGATAEVQQAAPQIAAAIGDVVKQLGAMSEQLQALPAQITTAMTATVQGLERVQGQLSQLGTQMTAASEKVGGVPAKVHEGIGALGGELRRAGFIMGFVGGITQELTHQLLGLGEDLFKRALDFNTLNKEMVNLHENARNAGQSMEGFEKVTEGLERAGLTHEQALQQAQSMANMMEELRTNPAFRGELFKGTQNLPEVRNELHLMLEDLQNLPAGAAQLNRIYETMDKLRQGARAAGRPEGPALLEFQRKTGIAPVPEGTRIPIEPPDPEQERLMQQRFELAKQYREVTSDVASDWKKIGDALASTLQQGAGLNDALKTTHGYLTQILTATLELETAMGKVAAATNRASPPPEGFLERFNPFNKENLARSKAAWDESVKQGLVPGWMQWMGNLGTWNWTKQKPPGAEEPNAAAPTAPFEAYRRWRRQQQQLEHPAAPPIAAPPPNVASAGMGPAPAQPAEPPPDTLQQRFELPPGIAQDEVAQKLIALGRSRAAAAEQPTPPAVEPPPAEPQAAEMSEAERAARERMSQLRQPQQAAEPPPAAEQPTPPAATQLPPVDVNASTQKLIEDAFSQLPPAATPQPPVAPQAAEPAPQAISTDQQATLIGEQTAAMRELSEALKQLQPGGTVQTQMGGLAPGLGADQAQVGTRMPAPGDAAATATATVQQRIEDAFSQLKTETPPSQDGAPKKPEATIDAQPPSPEKALWEKTLRESDQYPSPDPQLQKFLDQMTSIRPGQFKMDPEYELPEELQQHLDRMTSVQENVQKSAALTSEQQERFLSHMSDLAPKPSWDSESQTAEQSAQWSKTVMPEMSAQLDKAASQNISVSGEASISVDVKAPGGTSVGAETSGSLFKSTEITRQTQMLPSESGPMAASGLSAGAGQLSNGTGG